LGLLEYCISRVLRNDQNRKHTKVGPLNFKEKRMNWIKNSLGKPDAMLSFAVVSLGVVLLKFFFSEMSFGPITFGQIDGGTITAILAPTLTAYVARRHSDNITGQNDKGNDDDKQA
jgi:hypothetical protein